MTNRYLPHVLVLPEDDANRQLATGFLLDEFLMARRIQVLEEAGGWIAVLDRFKSEHLSKMDRYTNQFLVLLIDFDGERDRRDKVKDVIPPHLTDRVFVLGAWTEPEGLRQELGSYETIGRDLAKDCREGTSHTWSHALLKHNEAEVARLREHVRPFLF
jgi:hypothetical protein